MTVTIITKTMVMMMMMRIMLFSKILLLDFFYSASAKNMAFVCM